MESIITPGGHEVDFDRIIVEELKSLGHEVDFYVPEGFEFKHDYKTKVVQLSGAGVTYEGLRGFSKMLASGKREFNRQRWFRQLYQHACHKEFDAVIIPTATYRYLRALNLNSLRKSPVPIIFVIHGVNPTEEERFFKEVEKIKKYPNIKIAVLTFGDTVLGRTSPNVYCVKPPLYTPRDIAAARNLKQYGAVRLGFFGQYRKEKNLASFLDAFLACNYKQPVELFVQGATVKPSDAEDFERIIKKYSGYSQIKFLHKGLIGREWQEAIASVDAIIMPYASSRYRYHWSAMLFTAIGYGKTIVASEDINPEVTAQYDIGVTFNSSTEHNLHEALEGFVNSYMQKTAIYQQELTRAYNDYSPRCFAEALVSIASKTS